MNTTITGIFLNQYQAESATDALLALGFRRDQLHVVDAGSKDRTPFIIARSADIRRGIVLGAALGGLGGALAGMALTGVFGMLEGTLIGALAAAIGGALLGSGVGGATSSQVQGELEGIVDTGSVLVSVTTDAAHAPAALHLLAKAGLANMVSSTASFTAGVLSARPA